ncbi:MAG TPA: bacteriohopanetetrol glucosamine biosynthesis glycosyltransferase HpnI [Solirubrobacteraceae bacterium]|nr:bacteriohopanetetrol glucosamine biosynthesis glycosyltransferase HpnI [Solirubrobacteraceae bacterium]
MFATVIAAITTLLTLSGLGYSLVALWSARSFLRRPRFPAGFAPPVSVLKPLHGLEPGLAEAFASHCRQTYPGDYEILFGVSSLDDPVVPLVHRLQADFPERSIRLIHCADVLGPNGKTSNVAQLVPHARYDHLVINDADIHVGPHYLARIMAPFAPIEGHPPTGLVTALYSGRAHGTLGSRLEALGIATDFAPAVLTARYLDRGLRFGLGSTLAVSRPALQAIGGLAPLADYLADDYQLGCRIAQAGFGVELANEIVQTAVPAWTFSGFWNHQIRWARTMRDSRGSYLGLVFTYGLAWACLNLIATGFSVTAFALFSLTLLVRVSLALGIGVGILGDRQVLRDLWLIVPRDLLSLAIWAWSYAGNTVAWGTERLVLRKGKIVADASADARPPTAPEEELPQ